MTPRRAAVLALGLGALQAFAFAPWSLPALQIACVAGLALLTGRAASPRQGAALGLAFGFGWLAHGVWWLYISMHTHGGMPAWLAAAAVAALSAALALYLAGALALAVRLRSGRAGRDVPVFAALWLLAELARALIFTGFPWAASGYAHLEGPGAALAPWVGVYGIGAWAAALGALLAAVLRGGARLRHGAAAALLGLAPLALPQDFTRPAGTLRVALLQTAVPQGEKFSTALQPAVLQWLMARLADSPVDLVVAPETALPLLPEELPPGLWAALSEAFAPGGPAGGKAALIGLPLTRLEADGRLAYTNSVAGFSAALPPAAGPQPPGAAEPAPPYRYDKHHLVPFGEFIPPGFRWFVDLMRMPLGDFGRGPLVAPSLPVAGQRIGPNICYEDLFGEELAARYVGAGDAPTVLVNVSNLAWFDGSRALDQHREISRMRSLELQRPMLRATNTGATVALDHRGRLRAALPHGERGVLQLTVEGREGLTPYTRWAGRWGLAPLAGAALLTVLALGAWRRPRRG